MIFLVESTSRPIYPAGPPWQAGGSNACPCRFEAFTLLEVLLALGLSVVLLVAVAAAIDLYRRMTVGRTGRCQRSADRAGCAP